MKTMTMAELTRIKAKYQEALARKKWRILVCGGAGCVSSGCAEVSRAAAETAEACGLDDQVQILETGCMGTCSVGPVMLIEPEGIFYLKLPPEFVRKFVPAHLLRGEFLKE